MTRTPKPSARTKLLDAAVTLIRTKGFAATSVDDLCAHAGVTKGAFFHHFASKEALGCATAEHWADTTGLMFAAAAYHALPDPRDRLMGYLDLREALLVGSLSAFTCLAGTLVQETHQTSPAITAAAHAAITGHARTLEQDFAEAIALYGPIHGPSPASLALLTQTMLQGAFIVSKGQGDAGPAREALSHLRCYLTLLFHKKETRL